MTYTGRRVTDAFFARLRADFSEAELVELAAAIALENFRSKFNPVFAIESGGAYHHSQKMPCVLSRPFSLRMGAHSKSFWGLLAGDSGLAVVVLLVVVLPFDDFIELLVDLVDRVTDVLEHVDSSPVGVAVLLT